MKITEIAPQMAAVPSFHYSYDAARSLFQAGAVIFSNILAFALAKLVQCARHLHVCVCHLRVCVSHLHVCTLRTNTLLLLQILERIPILRCTEWLNFTLLEGWLCWAVLCYTDTNAQRFQKAELS